MNQQQVQQLYQFYRQHLFDKCLPFWLQNSFDYQYGGYITCLDKNGKIYNTDKSIWFQGRGVWLYAKLYNTVERKKEWLDAAELGYRFLEEYGFDNDGRMFFQVTKDGRPLRKRRYLFSETFAITAFIEYYLASGNEKALRKAEQLYDLVSDIYRNPSKADPKVISSTRVTKALSLSMILLNTTQELRKVDSNPKYEEFACELADEICRDFAKPDKKALFETVGLNGEYLDLPQGRCINPGHSIEAVWFLLQEGIYKNDEELIGKALNILDWSLEIGWDKEYGGIFYFVDIEGKPLEQLEWDMKLWWPHTEALYSTLLAYSITGNAKYEAWFDRIHNYSFTHFPDDKNGEWFGYLHRDGTVSNELKGSMWKGPFHLPRALLYICLLLEKMGKQVE